jgi:putative flippase GtrA
MSKASEIARFLLVGGASAAIDVGLMALLLHASVPALPAAAASFLVSLVFNYLAHAMFTFRTAATPANAVRYACVVALNLALSLAFVWIFERAFNAPLLGKIASLLVVAANTYWLGRLWIYRK